MKEITVNELITHQVNLEKELLELLNQKMREFKRNTGVGISNIHLSFLDVGQLGRSSRKEKILSGVSIYLDLEDVDKEEE